MNALPMIAECAKRQDPNLALEFKAAVAMVTPDWVVLWDACIPRVQHFNRHGGVDGPPRTWVMVVK